jgi:hypothetical protein
MLYPNEQSPEYSYDCIPSVKDWDDPRNYISFGFIAIIIVMILIGIVSYFSSIFQQAKAVLKETSLIPRGNAKDTGPVSTESPNSPVNEVKFQYVSSYQPDILTNDETASSPSKKSNSLLLKDLFSSYPSFPFLEGLLWFLIPFLPLTGIIFTLGTLLAERLLYLCSIGFCILLSIILWNLVSAVLSFPSSFPSSSSSTSNGSKTNSFLFSTIILVILSYYVQQTRTYNVVWKTDESLFFHALKVCPHSAKINLQVAKIYINETNYHKAMKLVNHAKEIDPTFCDVEYTEALILLSQANEDARLVNTKNERGGTGGTVGVGGGERGLTSNLMDGYEEKINKAMNLCLSNLHCVFTNKQSYKMLQDLWQHQLSNIESKLNSLQTMMQQFQQQQQNKKAVSSSLTEAGNNPAIAGQLYYLETELSKAVEEKIDLYEKQGRLAMENNLTVIGIQRYLDIAVFAYERPEYLKKTFSFLKKAEEGMNVLLAEHALSSSVISPSSLASLSLSPLDMNIRFLQCRIASLSGTFRSSLLQNSKTNKDYSSIILKLPKKALQNDTIYHYLQDATSDNCLLVMLSVGKEGHQQPQPGGLQQKMLFLEHIRMANLHFLQLFQSNFFSSFDIQKALLKRIDVSSSLMTKINNRITEKGEKGSESYRKQAMNEKGNDLEEIILSEFLRQLSIGFSLEFVTKKSTSSASPSVVEKDWNNLYQNLQIINENSFLQDSLTTGGKKNKKDPIKSKKAMKELASKSLLLQLIYIWNSYATSAYMMKDFSTASNYYAKIISVIYSIQQQNMEVFLTGNAAFSIEAYNQTSSVTVSAAADQKQKMIIPSILPYHFALWKHHSVFSSLFSLFGTKALKEEGKDPVRHSFTKSTFFCNCVYYYADSLVGLDRFYEYSDAIWMVTRLLGYYEKCIKYHQQKKSSDADSSSASTKSKKIVSSPSSSPVDDVLSYFPDANVMNNLVEKFRKTYCQLTDPEKQDYELCAYS